MWCIYPITKKRLAYAGVTKTLALFPFTNKVKVIIKYTFMEILVSLSHDKVAIKTVEREYYYYYDYHNYRPKRLTVGPPSVKKWEKSQYILQLVDKHFSKTNPLSKIIQKTNKKWITKQHTTWKKLYPPIIQKSSESQKPPL